MVSEDPEFAEFEFGGDDFCGSCAVIRFSVNLSRSVREYVPPLPPDDGPTGTVDTAFTRPARFTAPCVRVKR